jgi:radical SAM protein (TIGR01212 family)
VGGCIFCNPAGFSPGRRSAASPIAPSIARSITEQLEQGTRHIGMRYGVDRFVAYFQPATNTYAPLRRLRALYEEALARPDVVGLIVGTRPDCVGEDVLDLLAEFSERTWLSVEYGLQTIHDRSLDWLGRGHHYDAFLDAVERSHRQGLHVGAHVILGLPGETRQDMVATARELTRLEVDSVKIHNLHAVRDTPLARAVTAGEVALIGRDEYVGYVVDFLEELSPRCVVARLSGDAPPDYLVAPAWCLDKAAVRQAILAELQRRDTWQGRRAGATDKKK